MKLLRHGPAGPDRPGLQGRQGRLRDFSAGMALLLWGPGAQTRKVTAAA